VKKRITSFTFLIIWLITSGFIALIPGNPQGRYSLPANEGTVRLIVGVHPGKATALPAPQKALRRHDPAANQLEKLGVMVLDVPASEAEDRIRALVENPGIAFVQYDEPAYALDVYPDDTYFSAQYGLTNIRAPQGWKLETGAEYVTIAIVDSGVDFTHPDLAPKVLAGYDFVENDTIPQDAYGHGTNVAGIAAAVTNNTQGVAGVSWGAQILPVRVLDAYGGGSYSIVAAGIVYAVDNGAQIINLSLGGKNPGAVLESAVMYAVERGCLVVAASGNDASGSLRYPAAYGVTVSVGATNSLNQRWSDSNYGSGLDLMAPGDEIYSSTTGGGYGYRSGTSLAAPFVSGMAAVLWGKAGATTPYLVEVAMESSALDLGPAGWDAEYGFGLIQVDKALQYAAAIAKPTATSFPVGGMSDTAPATTTTTVTSSPVLTATIVPTVNATATLDAVRASILQTQAAQQTVAAATKISQSGWLPAWLACGLSAGGLVLGFVSILWIRRINQPRFK